MNNLEKVIALTNKAASLLEKDKLIKSAQTIDKYSKTIVTIKAAQYIGTQGYWIRNGRCWQNCYRDKRARNKDMKSQIIWKECHSEYVDSINNDDSGWEKYAEQGPIDMKKYASAGINIQDLLEKERMYFNECMIDEMLDGKDIKTAVENSINKGLKKLSAKIEVLKTKLEDLAIAHEGKKNEKVAELLLKASKMLK
jgi:hypothetical protein